MLIYFKRTASYRKRPFTKVYDRKTAIVFWIIYSHRLRPFTVIFDSRLRLAFSYDDRLRRFFTVLVYDDRISSYNFVYGNSKRLQNTVAVFHRE